MNSLHNSAWARRRHVSKLGRREDWHESNLLDREVGFFMKNSALIDSWKLNVIDSRCLILHQHFNLIWLKISLVQPSLNISRHNGPQMECIYSVDQERLFQMRLSWSFVVCKCLIQFCNSIKRFLPSTFCFLQLYLIIGWNLIRCQYLYINVFIHKLKN